MVRIHNSLLRARLAREGRTFSAAPLGFFIALGHLLGTYRIRLLKGLLLAVALLSLSTWFLWARSGQGTPLDAEYVASTVETSVLKYHVGGFYMLDDLMDQPVFKVDAPIPYYTLGYVQYLASLALRRFGVSIDFPQQRLFTVLTDPVEHRGLREIQRFLHQRAAVLPGWWIPVLDRRLRPDGLPLEGPVLEAFPCYRRSEP